MVDFTMCTCLVVLFSFIEVETIGPPMESSKFEEPTCVEMTPAPDIKPQWISKVAAWYIPMASKYVYHTWVEKLTNKSSTEDKFAQLCLKFLFLAANKPNAPYMVVAGGLNKAVGYKCTTKAPHYQECHSPKSAWDEVAVETDNQHYVLMVQCIDKKLKAWYVMTPSTDDLSTEVKTAALAAAVKLGFQQKHGAAISYNKCPKPK